MKLYTCKQFQGRLTSETSAIIVAESHIEAVQVLNGELTRYNLSSVLPTQVNEVPWVESVKADKQFAVILMKGDRGSVQ